MVISTLDGLPPVPAPAREAAVASNSSPQPATQTTSHAAATPEAVQRAVAQANDALASLSRAVEFTYDREANVTVIRLVDTQDESVLRQVPTPEMLEIARALDRMQTMLVREKA